MSKLVIVESPTKAKTITKFLGKDYIVESSFGHIRDLPKSKMGVDIEGGTFEPQYIIPKAKSKHVTMLKKKAQKADEVIFATDEDREGEAISWHLAQIFDIEPTTAKRIVFHEITKPAIEEALQNPRNIDIKLVDAQQARRVLDRLVGYELSPLLWKKVARGLSAGRVQSVAVRLIVERERERNAFNPQEYWTLTGIFSSIQTTNQTFEGTLHSIDTKKIDKLDIKSKPQIDTIVHDLADAKYVITLIEQKEQKRTPPPPFTTSTLQQAASNQAGYSAKQTMRIAQQLYEGVELGSEGSIGLITYMRTDSVNLSDKFLSEARTYVEKNHGKEYILETPRKYKTKSKGAQEAHEAIRPTEAFRNPESLRQYLNPQQYKIYNLIWKRALATQMQQARLNKTSIDISAKQYTFRTTGQTMIFDGWLALYPDRVKQEILPELKEREVIVCSELKPEQHFTEPAARYSDATLVKALEEHGIGRPSTYAPTIATIEDRGYAGRDEQKHLFPQDIAYLVNDLLVEHFPQIVDYGFTAEMEQNLDQIAVGEKDWKPIISTFYHPFHTIILQKSDELTKENTVALRELGTDPETGKPIFVRIGRYGPFVQKGSKDDEEKPSFAKLKKGQSIETLSLEQALELFTLPRIVGKTDAGNDITANVGRFGPYLQIEKKFYSLKTDDPYTINLERAKEVIFQKDEEEKNKIIKKFENSGIQILNGRYGPYITDTITKTNARIPKDRQPDSLTLEECETLIKEKPSKRRGNRKSK